MVERYTEPHRHYHTLDHLDEMCGFLDEHEGSITDYPAVVMVSIAHRYNASSPIRLGCEVSEHSMRCDVM